MTLEIDFIPFSEITDEIREALVWWSDGDMTVLSLVERRTWKDFLALISINSDPGDPRPLWFAEPPGEPPGVN